MDAMMRLALLIAIFIGCVNAACPPGFVASVTIPGKCYYFPTTNNTFFSAINYCRNLTHGADILSIANGFENTEVASLVQSAWVGNAFYDNKSHWIATAASSSNYSNWQPRRHNGQAALIIPSGEWEGTLSGDSYYGTICQIYPDDPATFPPPQITCPAGWTPSISVRGKCYQPIVTTDGIDFFSATRRCLTTRIGDSHAELLTLTSQLEMMELYWTQSSAAWVSLTRWEADGYWRWVETLHPTDYFGPDGHPSTSGTCAGLGSDDSFPDVYYLYGMWCLGSWGAICQYFSNEPPTPTLPGLTCPQNGIASLTKPGTCYYVLSQQQSFQSAQSACQTLNNGFNYNDLFVPRTLGEYEEFEWIVRNQFLNVSVWLGLTSSNGTWDWIPGRSSNITNIWCFGQPDTSQYPNHQCGFVNYQVGDKNLICWMAGDCTDSYTAICQSTNTF